MGEQLSAGALTEQINQASDVLATRVYLEYAETLSKQMHQVIMLVEKCHDIDGIQIGWYHAGVLGHVHDLLDNVIQALEGTDIESIREWFYNNWVELMSTALRGPGAGAGASMDGEEGK